MMQYLVSCFILELYQSAHVADRKEKVSDFNKVSIVLIVRVGV